MTDYFHADEDEDDPDALMADTDLVVIGRDRHGRPCFGCYFTALFDSFTDEELERVDAGDDLPAEVAEEARRHGASFSVVTDGLAYIISDIAGDEAIGVAEAICQSLMRQVMLHSVKPEGRPN
jgi:hypothetical protein